MLLSGLRLALTKISKTGEEEKEEVQAIWLCERGRDDGGHDRTTGSRDGDDKFSGPSNGNRNTNAEKPCT